MASLLAGILIGVVIASAFWRWPDFVRAAPFRDRIEALLAAIRQGAEAAARGPAPAPAPPENAGEPMTVKLGRLEAGFSPVSENASHPREFLDHPQFQEMTALLGSETVPLKSSCNMRLERTGRYPAPALPRSPSGLTARRRKAGCSPRSIS